MSIRKADPGAQPSLAEQARTLVHRARVGTLSTNSTRHRGFPFGSVMPYGCDAAAQPTFLISRLAVHTQNLDRNARASLLVCRSMAPDEALRSPRLTLLGHVTRVIDDGSVRDDYLERHPHARAWLAFGDFGFYRMEIVDAYYVAGFGEMGWISADDYRQAKPDPLADHAEGIIAHMNADHADALVLYCRAYAGIEAESAVMEDVDRLGICVRAKVGDERQDLRINFLRQARTPMEARAVLVEMVRDARASLSR
jgi:putative heme iron utilization protein